ncbi:MAG: hypothetical protein AB7G93_07825 [Bdellovibrionales bacterium]
MRMLIFALSLTSAFVEARPSNTTMTFGSLPAHTAYVPNYGSGHADGQVYWNRVGNGGWGPLLNGYTGVYTMGTSFYYVVAQAPYPATKLFIQFNGGSTQLNPFVNGATGGGLSLRVYPGWANLQFPQQPLWAQYWHEGWYLAGQPSQPQSFFIQLPYPMQAVTIAVALEDAWEGEGLHSSVNDFQINLIP